MGYVFADTWRKVRSFFDKKEKVEIVQKANGVVVDVLDGWNLRAHVIFDNGKSYHVNLSKEHIRPEEMKKVEIGALFKWVIFKRNGKLFVDVVFS